MNHFIKKIPLALLLFCSYHGHAQDSTSKKDKPTITGTLGVTYEGYGLSVNPSGSNFYSPRKPWNQVRFIFTPMLQYKKFSLPINFNFSSMLTSLVGPYAGLKHQSVWQFVTNPANNFAINPKYKWAELQLGTQYLHYSDLSTGDIGIFGAGVDLKPKTWRFKFFTGTSQQGINYSATPLPNGVTGAYQRNHIMFQVGNEKEGKYAFSFNFAEGKDKANSVSSPPLTIRPQKNTVASIVANLFMNKGWYIKTEAAQSYYTRNITPSGSSSSSPLSPGSSGGSGNSGASPQSKDWAANASVGKKSKNFDIAFTSKYIGAGFQTMGYPYMQSDILDNTVNTRFNAWKKKMNVVASVGERISNLSNTSTRSNQFIANVNWFTQFSQSFNLNVNFNNFGFTTASGTNPFGVKNVSNDLNITPTYTWSNTKMTNMLTLNYDLSKYNERDVNSGITTANNTNTILLSYVPVWFKSNINPDFSALYFHNAMPSVKNTLLTFSSGASMNTLKNKMKLKAQLQYTIGKINSFSASNNLVASLNMDYKITKKLTWNVYLATNYYKYGNELAPPASLIGANYLESNYRTGLQYKF